MKTHPHKSIIIWLFAGCFLIFAMVVIGGITRLTHSGLSMVEWNPIVGSLPPMSDEEWQIPFEKYQATPEYKILNNHFTLEEFKSIYWWEYIHRFLGRTIGIVFIIPFLFFVIKKKFDKPFLKKMYVLLLLGAFQGFLGWFMVKSGLNKEPAVSHYRLAAHLISAFTVFGFTFWYALNLIYPNNIVDKTFSKKFHSLVKVMFSVIVIQIIYGAFVAGLKAGLFYNTYPLMHDSYFPETVLSHEPFWKNLLENPAGVQFLHRNIAILVAVLVGIVWYKARNFELNKIQLKAVNILLGVVLVQFLLGIFTLLYAVPVSLGVLHQVGAFFLFSSALFFMHTIRKN